MTRRSYSLDRHKDQLYQLATASAEHIATGAGPVTSLHSVFKTVITTGGTQGAEDLVFGTDAEIGKRRVVVLGALTDPADSVTLDDASFSFGEETITAIELDAEDEYVFAEFRGAKWEILGASAGVVSVAP